MESPDAQWGDLQEFEVQRVRQEKLHRLRSCWELPCVVLFISVWKSPLGVLREFETDCESIEAALLDENDLLLAELHVKLLRTVLNNVEITYHGEIGGASTGSVWYDVLLSTVKEYGGKGSLLKSMEEAFAEDTDLGMDRDASKRAYEKLAVDLRVQLLYMLCNLSLSANSRLAEYVAERETEPDTLRLQNLGVDSERNTYYYMNDNRLYKEYTYVERKVKKPVSKPRGRPKNKERVIIPPRLTERQMARQQKLAESTQAKGPRRGMKRKASQPQPVKTIPKVEVVEDVVEPEEDRPEFPYTIKRRQCCWRAVCVTSREWKSLIARLSKSRLKVDKELAETLKTLAETVVPSLERAELAAEKARTLDALPRRSSSRVKTNEQMSERDKRIHTLKREEERVRLIAEKKKEEEKRKKQQAAAAERERERAEREAKNEEALRRRAAQQEKQRRAKEREIRQRDREATLEQERLEEEAIAAEREERYLLRTMPEEERIQYLASKEKEQEREASIKPNDTSSRSSRSSETTRVARPSRTPKSETTARHAENGRESTKASRFILVFSSAFANEAATAVMEDGYTDIGDYHRFYQTACQKGTKEIAPDSGGAC